MNSIMKRVNFLLMCGLVPLDSGIGLYVRDYTAYKSRPRRRAAVKLVCPQETSNRLLVSEDQDISPNATAKSPYSQGSRAVRFISRFRQVNSTFYQTLLNTVIMATCDLNVSQERCVEESSPEAAKDWDGSCLVAADSSCGPGMCERFSNCYWKPVVRGRIRETRFNPEDYPTAMDKLTHLNFQSVKQDSYIGEMLETVFGSMIYAAVALVLWLIFLGGRFCCCCLWQSFCKLCSPYPRESGYRCVLDLGIPVFIYFVCFVGIVFCTAIAWIGNMDIDHAATNTFFHSNVLIEETKQFLLRTKQPLNNIKVLAEYSSLEAKTILNENDFVHYGSETVVGAFSDFATARFEALKEFNSTSPVFAAKSEFVYKVMPLTRKMVEVLEIVRKDFLGNIGLLNDTVLATTNQLDLAVSQTRLLRQQVDYIEQEEYSYRTFRKLIILGIFLVSGSLTLLGFIAILTSTNGYTSYLFVLLNVAWITNAVLGPLSIVLGIVLLCGNFVVLDICEIMKIITMNFEPIMGDQLASAATAVLNNSNLAVAL